MIKARLQLRFYAASIFATGFISSLEGLFEDEIFNQRGGTTDFYIDMS